MHFKIILPEVYFKSWGWDKTSYLESSLHHKKVPGSVYYYTPDKEFGINPLLAKGVDILQL